MKVLMISRDHPPHSIGGIGAVSHAIGTHFPKYGIDLTVIGPYPRMGGTQKEVRDSVTIYRVPSLGSYFITKIPSFSYFASRLVSRIENDFDVIYSHASPLFCDVEKTFVYHFHQTRYGEYRACRAASKPFHALLNLMYVPMDEMAVKKADGVIVLTERMRGEIGAHILKTAKVGVIPNGVDTSFFRPLRKRRFTGRKKTVLYAGRIDAMKGIDTLFRACSHIRNTVDMTVVIAGDGPERSKLEHYARSMGLPVYFLGRISRDELVAVYNRADLFVLPSMYEGFPLVGLEAMACGTPTVASSVCPYPDNSRFETGNSRDLAGLMESILTSEKKMRDLSEYSLEISRTYAWEKVVPRIISFLEGTVRDRIPSNGRNARIQSYPAERRP